MIPLKPFTGLKDQESKPFAVFDIEARSWIEFLCLGYYDGDRYEQFIGDDGLKEFVDFIFSEQGIPTTIYAHFGGKYDFLFLLSELITMPEYKIENMIPRGSGILCFDVVKGRKRFKFSDSHAFLPFSLRKLTENFEVEHIKQEIDYEKLFAVTDELLYYMKFDVIGLYEVIEKYRSWPLIQQSGAKSTMASQALQVLRLYLPKSVPSLWPDADEFVRKAYFGGRTEIFKPFYNAKRLTDKLYVFDVNSLYPSVMHDNEFPLKPSGKVNGEFIENEMGFYHVKVRVPKDMYVPPLGTVQKVGISEKFIFPTGEFWGYWSSIELQYAMSLGVELLEVREGITFSSAGKIFKDYIEALYEIRLRAKKHSVDDILTKLLMNSCYGRFGLNKEREELLFDDGEEGLTPYCELETKFGPVRIVKKEKILEKTFSNVAVAAWVTSLARIHMHKIYMSCQDSLYYTDTDSIFTTKFFENGEGLGALKKENEWKAAIFLLPKTYIAKADMLKKVVMKGFDNKKIQHFEIDDFVTALEGELRMMRVDIDPQVARFKTALRKGKFLMMTEKSHKSIRSKYDKRLIYKTKKGFFDTRPLHIENGEIIR